MKTLSVTTKHIQTPSNNFLRYTVIKLSNDGSVAMVGGRFTTRGFSIF